jgi:hypothetical protein
VVEDSNPHDMRGEKGKFKPTSDTRVPPSTSPTLGMMVKMEAELSDVNK